MPGLEREGVEIMRWLARNVSQDLYVHIMKQYFPTAHVGKPKRGKDTGGADRGGLRYAEINRHVEEREVSVVTEAAREAGLWRFCEPAAHGGFNL
jgi:putative pyruvate formate lyase activating enzyme